MARSASGPRSAGRNGRSARRGRLCRPPTRRRTPPCRGGGAPPRLHSRRRVGHVGGVRGRVGPVRRAHGLLRVLRGNPLPPVRLRRFADPFYSVASAIDQAPGAMTAECRSWLVERIAWLRGQWAAMEFSRPPGLIHGEAHIGNVLRASSGQMVLGDWDHVAAGPRECDLIQIHFLRRRFGRASPGDIDAFAAAYGWDVREWPGLETLIAIREITGLSAPTSALRGSGRSPVGNSPAACAHFAAATRRPGGIRRHPGRPVARSRPRRSRTRRPSPRR